MLLIPCPFCGPRDEIEFRYRGDASVARPVPDASGSTATALVYERANPAGLHTEWWLHVGGCRQVLRVERDTRTHRITAVEVAR